MRSAEHNAALAIATIAAALLADEEDGAAPKNAKRLLTPGERAAKVRFAEIEADLDRAAEQLADVIAELQASISVSLAALLFDGVDGELTAPALVGRFNAAASILPESMAAPLRKATEQIAVIAAGLEEQAAERVVEEAKRQGVKPSRKMPDAYPSTRYVAAASVAALTVWERVITLVRRDVLGPQAVASIASFTRPQIAATVTEFSLDGALDLARQTTLQANRAGRDRAATAYKIDQIFASEILDGNTCKECRAVDGQTFGTFEEGRAAYPYGGYKACDGGLRCRGTLVYVMGEDGEMPPPPPPWEPDEWASLDDVIPQF